MLFVKLCPFKEAFEAIKQLNKELKRAEFDGAWGKNFKLPIYRFFSFFPQNVGKW